MAIKIGVCPVIIEYPPQEILSRIHLYEQVGFDLIWEGDHTLPWHHTGGHSASALVMVEAYLQMTKRIPVHYMVSGIGLRHHPYDIALQIATMSIIHNGRVGLHIGTGEAMNEKTTVGKWPSAGERIRRTEEAIRLIRFFWESNDYARFNGRYFKTFSYIYDKPRTKIPLIGVAGGPKMAEIAGMLCDGLLSLGSTNYLKSVILPAFEKGAKSVGKEPSALQKMVFIDTSYHPDLEKALRKARLYGGVLIPECYSMIQDPRIIEQRSNLVKDSVLMDVFAIGTTPEEIIRKYEAYKKIGFDTLIWAEISPEPLVSLDACREIIPALKSI